MVEMREAGKNADLGRQELRSRVSFEIKNCSLHGNVSFLIKSILPKAVELFLMFHKMTWMLLSSPNIVGFHSVWHDSPKTMLSGKLIMRTQIQ